MSRQPHNALPHLADMRIGVTQVDHRVLDRADELTAGWKNLGSDGLLAQAVKAAAAAHRAKPDAGMGNRRKEQAIEAAAQLIAVLNLIEIGK